MEFRFDPIRATQAAGVLIAGHNGVARRSRLMPLLYMAERELIAATGRIITGDRVVATNQGPYLARTWKVLKRGEVPVGPDGRCIEPHGTEVVLRSEPGRDQLTRREVETLTDLLDRHRGLSTAGLWAIVRGLPEYLRHFRPDRVEQIPWEAVLTAAAGPDRSAPFLADHQEQVAIDSIFGALHEAGG